MKIALSIAGFDPSGGAGVLADIKTFHALGVYGTAIITAMTVQNSSRVDEIYSIKKGSIHQQILCLADEFSFDSIKIGMLRNGDNVEEVWDALQQINHPSIVLDPVLSSTSGSALLDDEGESKMIKLMFPLVSLLTPNIPEAESLSGLKIHNKKDVEKAAVGICKMGVRSVLIKGGHNKDNSDDYLLSPEGQWWFESKRLSNREIHGTGCTLAAAIAANLALGCSIETSVSNAKTYINKTILRSIHVNSDKSLPNHFPEL